MNIGSLCKRDAVTIDAQSSLQQAAQRMREQHVGALVVIGAGSDGVEVRGVVTDRDLAIEVLARGRDGSTVPLEALVGGRLVAVPHSTSLSEATAVMADEGVRRLLVTGKNQQLIGVVSMDDLIEALAGDLSRLAQSLRKAREREEREMPAGAIAADDLPQGPLHDALLQQWRPRA